MKKILIGLSIVVLVILAVVYMGKKEVEVSNTGDNSQSTDVTQIEQTPAKTNTVTKTTKPTTTTTPLVTNLFPQKGSFECRYDQATQTGRSTNTVYIADGKMRGEFRSTDAQGFASSNMMVYDGTYLYSWIEGKGTGVRTQPKSLKDIPAAIPTDVHEGKVLGSGIENVSWDCHAWSKVSTMLAKPSYVKFN
jgi:hypothetical protein